MRGDAPMRVDEMQLPVLTACVLLCQQTDHFGGRRALRKQRETRLGIKGIDERLRRQRADAASRVRAQDADREETTRNGNAERAIGVVRKERPGHRRWS